MGGEIICLILVFLVIGLVNCGKNVSEKVGPIQEQQIEVRK